MERGISVISETPTVNACHITVTQMSTFLNACVRESSSAAMRINPANGLRSARLCRFSPNNCSHRYNRHPRHPGADSLHPIPRKSVCV